MPLRRYLATGQKKSTLTKFPATVYDSIRLCCVVGRRQISVVATFRWLAISIERQLRGVDANRELTYHSFTA